MGYKYRKPSRDNDSRAFSGADPGNFHESPNHFPKRSHGGGCQIYREI